MTGCQSSPTGSRRKPASKRNRPRAITQATSPEARPSRAKTGRVESPGKSCVGTEKSGSAPNSTWCIAPATEAARTSGSSARVENSNRSSSTASTTAAIGAPKVAAMPAAAPLASRIFRSDGETGRSCPRSEPAAPPVTMIGPSAPKGPPVPMASAAEMGLATATRGAMRLWRSSTASIVSGMPWPRIAGAHRASRVTARAPAIATSGISGLRSSSVNDGASQLHWWKRARLVTRPMRWTRSQAAPPPMRPRSAPSALSAARRECERMARSYRDTMY